jgi:hypothetical protein
MTERHHFNEPRGQRGTLVPWHLAFLHGRLARYRNLTVLSAGICESREAAYELRGLLKGQARGARMHCTRPDRGDRGGARQIAARAAYAEMKACRRGNSGSPDVISSIFADDILSGRPDDYIRITGPHPQPQDMDDNRHRAETHRAGSERRIFYGLSR